MTQAPPSSNTWGTPTIAALNNSGAAAIGGTWTNADNAFSIILSPTASIPAGTVVATVTFGKPFLNNAGTAVVPACGLTSVASAGAAPLYVSGVSSGTNASSQTVQVLTLSTAPYGAAIASGAGGYFYSGVWGPNKQ